jgi:hypothetical protein
MSPRLQLRLDRDRFAPGDAVTGTVVVTEGGRSRSLEIVLAYVEQTKDYREVARSISTGHLHAGNLDTGATYRFEIALPSDALPGFASEHGQLYWELDVKSDERGRDSHERHRIEVVV